MSTTTNEEGQTDARIPIYQEATERIQRGKYKLNLPISPPDQIGALGGSLQDLARSLETRYQEAQKVQTITDQINAGLPLKEVLDQIYESFRELIPYNRIGVSVLEANGTIARSIWARTDQPIIKLDSHYSAPLARSSLKQILETGQPRIINDLVAHLKRNPSSLSTQLIVDEGIRSSLTCPLIANGVAIGFIFFSSVKVNAYEEAHIALYQQIAGQLSVLIEKGQLVSHFTDQKALIETKNEELRVLNQHMNQLLGMVAHDLRGPLGTVYMGSDLLINHATLEGADDETLRVLDDIRSQSDYMIQLVDGLLDLSAIEAGQLDLHPKPLILSGFLAEAVERHEKVAALRKIKISLSPTPAGSVTADPVRLRQVMDNLIGNALKFCTEDCRIDVYAEPVGLGWRVIVRDNGPGLKSEDLSQLFDDFVMEFTKASRRERSMGLGLAISRRIIEAHGGEIGVKPNPGKGSIFWFTLVS